MCVRECECKGEGLSKRVCVKKRVYVWVDVRERERERVGSERDLTTRIIRGI